MNTLKTQLPLKTLFFFVCFSFFFSSCTDDACSNVDPTCACANFLLLDRWGAPMIGENKMYHPDSIKMLNAPEKWSLRVEDSLVFFDYGLLNSKEEYYFYLSSSAQDTITVKITNTPGECFTTKNISEFNYSGAKANINGNYITVIKL